MTVWCGTAIRIYQREHIQSTLQTINSCDSVVTLNLTIYNSAIGDTVATACDSLVWRGVTYISSGTYSDTLQTINGCDSVVTLNLTINPSPTIELGDDTTFFVRVAQSP